MLRLISSKLNEAIFSVSNVLSAQLEQKKTEFEWLKSHSGFATKKDLEEMESRIIKSIDNIKTVSPSVEKAVKKEQIALDKLDNTIKDK